MGDKYTAAEIRLQIAEWQLAMRKALPPSGPTPWPQMTVATIRFGLLHPDALSPTPKGEDEG